MTTNLFGISPYPFTATFLRIGIDETKPLDERTEEEVVVYESKCDFKDNEGERNDTMKVYIPLGFQERENAVKFAINDIVRCNTYGVIQEGEIIGIFPSQIGGCEILLKRI